MVSEIEKFDFFNLNVKVAKPLIDVTHVFLLNILEFVSRKIHVAVQEGYFKLASVDFKVTVNYRECSPPHDNIVCCLFT